MQTINELFNELDNAILEAFSLSNSSLDAKVTDKRSKRTSLAHIAKKLDSDIPKLSKSKALKAEKAKRVEQLAQQWANNPEQPLRYDEHDRLLNNKQIAFVGAMMKAGIIDDDNDDDNDEYYQQKFYDDCHDGDA